MSRINKMVLFGALSVSFLLGSLGVALAQDEGLKPSIFIPKMRHDYGRVFERETYEYTFVVQNRGKADLVIQNVKPG